MNPYKDESLQDRASGLRQALAEAFDRQDLPQAQALSGQIDEIQLALWREEEAKAGD